MRRIPQEVGFGGDSWCWMLIRYVGNGGEPGYWPSGGDVVDTYRMSESGRGFWHVIDDYEDREDDVRD